MKKTYFVPKTVIVQLRPSPVMRIGSTSESQATQGASNFSREDRGSVWDDDEE